MSQEKESLIFKPFTYNGVILYNPNDYTTSTYQMSESPSSQNTPNFKFQAISGLRKDNNVDVDKKETFNFARNDGRNDKLLNSNISRRSSSVWDTRAAQNTDPFIASTKPGRSLLRPSYKLELKHSNTRQSCWLTGNSCDSQTELRMMETYDGLNAFPPPKKRREFEMLNNNEEKPEEEVRSTVNNPSSQNNAGLWPQPQNLMFLTAPKVAPPVVVEKKTRNVAIMTNLIPTTRHSSHLRTHRSEKRVRKEKATQFLFRGVSTLSDTESSSPAFSTPPVEVVEELYVEYETSAEIDDDDDDDEYETIDDDYETEAVAQIANCESMAVQRGDEVTPIFSAHDTPFSSATDNASFDLNDYLSQLTNQGNEPDILLNTGSNNSKASFCRTPEPSHTQIVEVVASAPANLGNGMKPVLTTAVAGMSLKAKVSFFKKVLGLFHRNKDFTLSEAGIQVGADRVKVKSSTPKKKLSSGLFWNSQRKSERVGVVEKRGSGNNNPPQPTQTDEETDMELSIKHIDSVTLMKQKREQIVFETRELCRRNQIRFPSPPVSKVGNKSSLHSSLRRVQSMIEDSSSGIRIMGVEEGPQSFGSTTTGSVSQLSDSVIFAIQPPPQRQK